MLVLCRRFAAVAAVVVATAAATTMTNQCRRRSTSFRSCNQRLLIELLSSVADADAPAADRSTAVVAAAVGIGCCYRFGTL